MFKLRKYQEKAVEAGVTYLKSDSKKLAVAVLPTGSGKSIILAKTIEAFPNQRFICLQPNKEILSQNYLKLKQIAPEIESSIYSASLGSKNISQVVFATIGSIKQETAYYSKYPPIIIVDECDNMTLVGSAIDKFIKKVKPPKVYGLTATPIVLQTGIARFEPSELVIQTRSRKNIFNEIIHVTQISELVEKGYWSPIIYDSRTVDLGQLKLNSTGSDFTQLSVQKHYTNNTLQEKARLEVSKCLESGRKNILVFVPSIAEAEELKKLIPNSETVHSKMHKKDRDRIINDFKFGELKVVINCSVLGVGFDHEKIDTILMLAASSSLRKIYQFFGRGLRIHPNKENCRIIDFAGNIERFGKLETLEFRETRGLWGLYQGAKKLTRGEEYAPMKRNDLFTFGKYLGIPITEVPKEYLIAFVGEYKKEDELKKKIVEYLGK